jgi:Ca-activated chloride channel family protein
MPLSLLSSYKAFALISLLISFTLIGGAQELNQDPTSREPVIFTATLTSNKGTFVIGLEKDNFEVFIDKAPAQILYAWIENVPISVGIVFDASASVGYPGSNKATRRLMNDLQRALKSFIDRSNQANEYFLLAFNNKPQLLLDWTSDSRAIMGTLGGVQPKGITAFYDACYLAINKVQHGRYPKRVLIVISDGEDNNSHYFFKQVRDALKESDVVLYALNVSDPAEVGSTLGMEGQKILNELSTTSGGASYYQAAGRHLRSEDAVSVFELIATELQNQYTIAIKPGAVATNDSQWHKLKLKVTPPRGIKLSARTREGFYLNQR